MNKIIIYIFILFFINACSSGSIVDVKKELRQKETTFLYTDKNGQFLFRFSSGVLKKSKAFFTKQSLELTTSKKDNTLEQTIAFSTLGSIKKKKLILRPRNSEYKVWFEGKQYSSKLKIIPTKKTVELTMTSPEAKWNGVKEFKFPNTKTITCFFSQVVDCAKLMGILESTKVIKFNILWEGYPYLNETFSGFPMEIFSKAELEYEGKKNKNEKQFSLHVAGQTIVYVLDEKNKFKKMFWVSQGISVVRNNSVDLENNSENKDE